MFSVLSYYSYHTIGKNLSLKLVIYSSKKLWMKSIEVNSISDFVFDSQNNFMAVDFYTEFLWK